MAANMKRCRVCGKPYKGCRSARSGDGVFRWQEVACSPEHGAQYLAAVNIARNVAAGTAVVEKPVVDEAPAIVAEKSDHTDYRHLSKKERRALTAQAANNDVVPEDAGEQEAQ